MKDWFDVCAAKEVPGLTPLKVEVEGVGVLICRHLMGFYAVNEICPHEHASMAGGRVVRSMIICPHHQLAYDLKTGVCLDDEESAPAILWETRVVEGRVEVRKEGE